MTAKRQPKFDPRAFLARIGDGPQHLRSTRRGRSSSSRANPRRRCSSFRRARVKVSVVSEQGKEAVVAILGKDEFVFGEGCWRGRGKRISTVYARSDAVITRIEKAAILRLIHEDPSFSEVFIAHLLSRAVRVEADLIDQLFNFERETALARTLLLLANFGQQGVLQNPRSPKSARRRSPRWSERPGPASASS